MANKTDEAIVKRLKDLYKSRLTKEYKLGYSLRYNSDPNFIADTVQYLTEVRGRIQELENLISYQDARDLYSEVETAFYEKELTT